MRREKESWIEREVEWREGEKEKGWGGGGERRREDLQSLNQDLTRVDLVALGLLLGSDYCPGGVPSVGKKLALQLVRAWKRRKCGDLLERFRTWTSTQLQEG